MHNNNMKRMLFVLMVLIYFPLMAQFNGSDWIDFSKPHLKFKHDKDQLVRIDFFAVEGGLFQLGTAIQSIPFSSYRIFSNGQQVPILVTDVNSNNTWDPADYIEFVAHKNDGKFDSLLFDNKNYQRHQLQSFYTDFRAYYLSYRTSGTQLRYTDVSSTTPSPDPVKKSHEAIVTKFGDDIYFNGKSILLGSLEAEFSDYKEGEGFYGPSLTTPTRPVPGGTEKDSTIPMYTLPIPAPNIDLTGFNPSISIGTVNTVAYYSFLSHWLIFKVSPDGSSIPRRIGDTMSPKRLYWSDLKYY
jgi:hypothetical protein